MHIDEWYLSKVMLAFQLILNVTFHVESKNAELNLLVDLINPLDFCPGPSWLQRSRCSFPPRKIVSQKTDIFSGSTAVSNQNPRHHGEFIENAQLV